MYRYSTVRLMSDQLPIIAAAARPRHVLNLVDLGRGPATLAGRLQPDKLPAVIGTNLGAGAGAVHPVHRLAENRHGTTGHEVPDPLTAGGLQMHDNHGLRRAIVEALHVALAVSLCPVLQLHERARDRVPDLTELGGVTAERARVRDLIVSADV